MDAYKGNMLLRMHLHVSNQAKLPHLFIKILYFVWITQLYILAKRTA